MITKPQVRIYSQLECHKRTVQHKAGRPHYLGMMMFIIGLTVIFSLVSFTFSVYTGSITAIVLLVLREVVRADADSLLYLLEKWGPASGPRLRGRVVWLTGASRGIGAALAVRLARDGARLALSARDEDKLHDVKQSCIEAGAAAEDVLLLPLDVKHHDKHQESLQAVLKHFGKLCVLVSNAGRSQRARWDAIDISVDRDMFELNVFSLVALARVVNKYFRKNGGGHHVVTSSIAGKIGAPGSSSYTASKHALHGYFESLRIEGSSDNISVTMLCPGPVDSELLKSCYSEQLDAKVDKVRAGTRMSAERCADLSATAIGYKLPEAWISQQPVLAIQYVLCYCPVLLPLGLRFINFGMLMKLRDGRSDVVPQTAE